MPRPKPNPKPRKNGTPGPDSPPPTPPLPPPPQWRGHLSLYKELRALIFENEKDINEAIDLLWTDEMYGLPHDIAGGDTLIVPPDAVPYFQGKGWKFRDTRLIPMSELSPEEKRELRRNGIPG
jgi:hypothetical protein